MSSETEIKTLSDLVEQIKTDIGRLLGTNITVAIINSNAEIKYIDTAIKKFSDFIISFTKGNFDLLSVGDHSLPLSGTNIAFFKVSEKALVILNSDKGPVGQLLAFKGRMRKYSTRIDELLEALPEKEEKPAPVKAAVRVPVLTVSIANKKFGMEEAKVLHLVNGKNTITDICEKTKLPQLKVDEIIRKYQKKKWIKLKRLIVGLTETPSEKKVEKPKKAPPTKPEAPSVEKEVEKEVPPPPISPPEIKRESIYLFPILEENFNISKFPKPDSQILQYCDGQHTITDIVNETGLAQLKVMEIIKKYEKKGKLTLSKIVPPAPSTEIPTPPPPTPSTVPETSISTDQTSTKESEEQVFDTLIQLMEETQPINQETTKSIPQSTSPTSISSPSSPSPPPSPSPSESTTPTISHQETSPSPPATPPVSPPPEISTTSEPSNVTEIKGEPVSDTLFDDLKSFLDETAPIAPPAPAAETPAAPAAETPAAPAAETPAAPAAETPAAPAAETPTITVTETQGEAASKTISSEVLLEETQEGIKITTYSEEDPLQARLERLSNILEDTTDEIAEKEVNSEVKIIGSKAICPVCKTHVTMMAKICPNCQRPLRVCPNCKSPITLFARICPSCGSLL